MKLMILFFLLCGFMDLIFISKLYLLIFRNLKPNNKVLFLKLKKNYLNNCDDDDIKDLLSFLLNELINRKKKGKR